MAVSAVMMVMDGFDGLLEADGDEQAYADGGDVEEEVAQGAGAVMGWVDVEHKGLLRCGDEGPINDDV